MSSIHPSMTPNKIPLGQIDRCPRIWILESPSLAILGGGSNRDEGVSLNDSTATYRKLRRRNGDCSSRKGMGSMKQSRHHCSVSSNGIAKAIAVTIQWMLVLQIGRSPMGWAEASYLNGANSDLSKGLPPHTTTSATPPPPPAPLTQNQNQRYTFQSRPMDKYFTSTGILPPLSQSPSEDYPNALWFPSSTRPTTVEDAITVTYTNDPDTVDSWLCHNVPYDGCFLGFDIERLPECRSTNRDSSDRSDFAHAAVVQLATLSACLVVHLVDSGSSLSNGQHPKHSNACARILRTALEDPSIVKTGCSIDEDLVLLHELWARPWGSKSARVRNNRSRSETAQANGPSDANQLKQNTPYLKRNRTHQKSHHQSSKSRKAKNGLHLSKSHQNKPSLLARSRFDLGCVILPKDKDSIEGNHADAKFPSMMNCEQSNGNAKSIEDALKQQPHYKIMAKRTDIIHHKSGLRGLCMKILGVDLPKEKEDCASDWTRFPLTDDQITYAARDAWAGVAIATKLASMKVEHISSNMIDIHSTQTRVRQQDDSNSCSDKPGNDIFSLSNLIRVLGKSETPLPQLAERHRHRKNAKTELRDLLHPYTKNQFLNQQNQRRHQELLVLRQNQPTNSTTSTNDARGDKIDIQALFAGYPLSSKRTLANYGQQQHQLMEKSLPKRIKKKSLVLRQMVNAKVIDHKVIFEIKLVRPDTKHKHSVAASESSSSKQQRHHSSTRRRYSHKSTSTSSKPKSSSKTSRH